MIPSMKVKEKSTVTSRRPNSFFGTEDFSIRAGRGGGFAGGPRRWDGSGDPAAEEGENCKKLMRGPPPRRGRDQLWRGPPKKRVKGVFPGRTLRHPPLPGGGERGRCDHGDQGLGAQELGRGCARRQVRSPGRTTQGTA